MHSRHTIRRAHNVLVIPSTQMTPACFKKIGVAGTCVFGNSCTAVVTFLLLLIGNFPATQFTFGLFVFVMYAGTFDRSPLFPLLISLQV